ncbi:collagenase-like [Topomyia yanbarensis]|uniref:collagenase-like n=1 Tax=Topomyia yanbarensis TaxID=2498891 RepID=UPI00273AB166|nr:collagenase-like [Topomyia yanbarensis]
MFGLTVVTVSLLAVVTALSAEPYSRRIVNGETAAEGQFPYQVLLKIQLPQGRALCGGSLLSDQWVLTAGHCVQGASSFEVSLGALDLADNGNDGRVVITATEYIRHEKYNPLFAANDVAVIKLPTPVVFNDRIQPVKLPTSSDNYADQKVVVSGWGIQKNGGNVAERLQFAILKVITNGQCMRTFSPLVIKKTTLCAQGEAKQSPCNGDSGGPLVLEGGNELVGVVSFGHATGCERGFPGAFARITSFTEWIKKKTGI